MAKARKREKFPPAESKIATLCHIGLPGCTCRADTTIPTKSGPGPACTHCAAQPRPRWLKP